MDVRRRRGGMATIQTRPLSGNYSGLISQAVIPFGGVKESGLGKALVLSIEDNVG